MLGGNAVDPKDYTLTLPGGGRVVITARPWSAVTATAARLSIRRAVTAYDDASGLIDVLTPKARQAIDALDQDALLGATEVWFAARVGAEVVTDWSDVHDPDGKEVEYSPEHFQLACLTVPEFADRFLLAWQAPELSAAAAGNG